MRQAFNVLPWIPPPEFDEIRDIYFHYGTIVKISKNTLIKSSGDENKLFYLKKGLCMCSVNGYPDRTLTLAILLPGRAIGDLTCISGETVNMNIIVKRESEVLSLPATTLMKYMKKDPNIGILMAKTVLAKRNSHLEGMITNNLFSQDGRLRVLFCAIRQVSATECVDGWYKIEIKLSNEEIANVINSTRVSVSRILSTWSDMNIYKKVGNNRYVHENLLNSVHDWHE